MCKTEVIIEVSNEGGYCEDYMRQVHVKHSINVNIINIVF